MEMFSLASKTVEKMFLAFPNGEENVPWLGVQLNSDSNIAVNIHTQTATLNIA